MSHGRALYVGPAGDTRAHRHHALQLVVGLDGAFAAQIGRSEPREFEAILVGAEQDHRIEGGGLSLAIYYVDASCDEGRMLSGWLGEDRARSVSAELVELRQAIEATLKEPRSLALSSLSRRISETLELGASTLSEKDPAVAAATALLEESLTSPLPVPDLACRVGLRQRELSARFRKETGLSIRRYVLWLRLKAAVSTMAEDRTLTEAAHEAGFADAAHLSRTFVQMFGVAPSEGLTPSTIEVTR